jgi:hypothetical protein
MFGLDFDRDWMYHCSCRDNCHRLNGASLSDFCSSFISLDVKNRFPLFITESRLFVF